MRETMRLPGNDETEPMIADVGRIPLETLLASDDSALASTIRRVIDELGRPGENYAAHGTTP